MNTKERLYKMKCKLEQAEHQQILRENRTKNEENKIEISRIFMAGRIFIKHFPIVLEFTPGKTLDENNQIFKPLDDFMEALSKCQQAYQTMEDSFIQSRQN